MSYRTLEVELEDGRVRAAGADTLPAKARALLTILDPTLPSTASPTASLADLTADLAGIGKGTYTDLSTNRTHMADFGCGCGR